MTLMTTFVRVTGRNEQRWSVAGDKCHSKLFANQLLGSNQVRSGFARSTAPVSGGRCMHPSALLAREDIKVPF